MFCLIRYGLVPSGALVVEISRISLAPLELASRQFYREVENLSWIRPLSKYKAFVTSLTEFRKNRFRIL